MHEGFDGAVRFPFCVGALGLLLLGGNIAGASVID